ncbi:MAG: ATP-binding protein [Candidatus Thiodiazotropha endolucinida]
MATIIDFSSLRGKITTAYLALAVGTLVLGIIAFSDLMFLERQVSKGEAVADFKDAVLEMRREEKNLFLYADEMALARADEYARSSQGIAQRYRSLLTELMKDSEISIMTGNLVAYRHKLESWKRIPADARPRLENEIREIGHRIYLTAESLASRERRMLETSVQESQWFLLVSLILVGLAIYMVGRQLKQVVLSPLKQLESRLQSIGDGRLNHLQPPSSDREFITFTDVFNRMLKELEIRQKRMLQSEKLASLGILASGVAHELNNPLSNISTSCQLVMEELNDADPDQLQTWLKQIDHETARGRNIVRTLLDFGSKRAFQKTTIKLLDVVDETKTIIEKTVRQYSARLSVNIPNDLTLEIDKQRIQQLFINLIQNALHAAGEEVHISISAMMREKGPSLLPEDAEMAGNLKCATDHGGRFVEILVTDDGPGISTENLAKVFDPFFTTSEPGQGVGLGLFIVQEIAREHDGCLAIASKPGEGTQVIVLLPLEDADHG